MTNSQASVPTWAESWEQFRKNYLDLLPNLTPKELFAYGYNQGFDGGNAYGKAAGRTQLIRDFTKETSQ